MKLCFDWPYDSWIFQVSEHQKPGYVKGHDADDLKNLAAQGNIKQDSIKFPIILNNRQYHDVLNHTISGHNRV